MTADTLQRHDDVAPKWPGAQLEKISRKIGELLGSAIDEGSCDNKERDAARHKAVAYSARLGMALVISDAEDGFTESTRTAAVTPCNRDGNDKLVIVRDVSKTYSLSWNVRADGLHLDTLSPPISDANSPENPLIRVEEVLDAEDLTVIPYNFVFQNTTI